MEPSRWTSGMSTLTAGRSRAVSPENLTGAKGAGGAAVQGTGAAAARDLGRGWKVSPSIEVPAGQVVTLADIGGPGGIRHVWLTPHPRHWPAARGRPPGGGPAAPGPSRAAP